MRITLAGCGALGSVFGAGLIESGAELQIYQRRGVTFDTLSRQGGIRLISAGESQPRLYPFSRISDRAGELEPADLILVLVKAYQTSELSSLTAGLLEDGAV